MRVFKKIARKWLFSTVFFLLFQPVFGQVFTYVGPPNPGAFSKAEFYLHVPAGQAQIKGIYFTINGYNGSSQSELQDQALRALVERHGFALLTAHFISQDSDQCKYFRACSGSFDLTLAALDTLARKSGHPEIKTVKLFLDGYSAGGQFAYGFAAWRPGKVMALLAAKGGYHLTDASALAWQVPAYLIFGQNDEAFRRNNLLQIYRQFQNKNPLWAIAQEPNKGHERPPFAVRAQYFESMVHRNAHLGTPAACSCQDWEGVPGTLRIFAASTNSGNQYNCWFPTNAAAEAWKAFSAPITELNE